MTERALAALKSRFGLGGTVESAQPSSSSRTARAVSQFASEVYGNDESGAEAEGGYDATATMRQRRPSLHDRAPLPLASLQRRPRRSVAQGSQVVLFSARGTMALPELSCEAIVGIDCGDTHFAAVSVDGMVYCRGGNQHFQCGGRGETLSLATAVLSISATVLEVACGGNTTAVITDTGQLFVWGAGESGQLGNGQRSSTAEPQLVDLGGRRVAAVALGSNHCAACCDDGALFAWGANSFGQCGIGQASEAVLTPMSVPLAAPAKLVACGRQHTIVSSAERDVLSFGGNMYGQLGNGRLSSETSPTAVLLPPHIQSVIMVSSGYFHSVLLTGSGELWGWGEASKGQLGGPVVRGTRCKPAPLPCVSNVAFAHLSCSAVCTLAASDNGVVYGWGRVADGEKNGNAVSALEARGISRVAAAPGFGVALTDGRFEWINSKMRLVADDFTNKHTVSVWCGTFNVNNKPPSSDIRPWLSTARVQGGKPADVLCIGLQEVDLTAGALLAEETKRGDAWRRHLDIYLHDLDNYTRVACRQLVGIYLAVYVRTAVCDRVSEPVDAAIGAGLLGVMGNKGAVACSIRIFDSYVAFVSSHLAAGEESERCLDRNQNWSTVMQTAFQGKPCPALGSHDVVFWVGDLNYRLSGCSMFQAKALIAQSRWSELLEYDQLRREMREGNSFIGFHEAAAPAFPPTYKFDVGTDTYDTSEKQRMPAWCDRVLWMSNRGKVDIVADSYTSSRVLFSDHRPVSAAFHAEVYEINIPRMESVRSGLLGQLQQREDDDAVDVAGDGNLLGSDLAASAEASTWLIDASIPGPDEWTRAISEPSQSDLEHGEGEFGVFAPLPSAPDMAAPPPPPVRQSSAPPQRPLPPLPPMP